MSVSTDNRAVLVNQIFPKVPAGCVSRCLGEFGVQRTFSYVWSLVHVHVPHDFFHILQRSYYIAISYILYKLYDIYDIAIYHGSKIQYFVILFLLY